MILDVTHRPHFHRKAFLTALCLLLSFTLAKSSLAQTVQADQAELARSQTALAPNVSPSGIVNGRAVSSPNDSDLGEQQILKRVEEYEPFTASVAVPIYYTSNVALTNSGERSDLITAPVGSVVYQPRITKTLYGLVDVRQQLFYYNQYPAFDFGSMDVEAGLIYLLPQFHNLILRAEYDFNRLTSSDRVLDEFYQNHSVIVNAEVPFRISRAAQVSLGGDANISVAADHQAPRRNDYDGYASCSVLLTRSLSIGGAARVVVRNYHQNNRTDVSEIVSATASLRLTNWWTVSAIGTFARSDSNHDVFDYSVVNAGGALALTAKF